MQVSVIIVNYNVKYFLEQALLSVRRAAVGLAKNRTQVVFFVRDFRIYGRLLLSEQRQRQEQKQKLHGAAFGGASPIRKRKASASCAARSRAMCR